VSFGCGVRLDDGEVFLVDAPPPVAGMRSLNVFESLPGFRSCFQSELDAIICDEPDPPSVVNVRFEISNNTSGPVWVVHEGNFCTPFEVRRLPDLTQLILSPVAQSSTCSCFQGDPTHSGKIVRLERGSTLTISWTGYELENYAALVACPTDTWACPYGYRPLSAAAGRYQAAFGAIRDAQNIYVVACETNGFCGYAGGFTWPNSCIRGLVGSDEIARPTVEFDLPETGDVVVPVSID
jgi:hypothetical protein